MNKHNREYFTIFLVMWICIIFLIFYVKAQNKPFVYKCPNGCIRTTFTYYCSNGELTRYKKYSVDEYGNFAKNDFPIIALDFYQCNSCLSIFDEKRLENEARLYNQGLKK